MSAQTLNSQQGFLQVLAQVLSGDNSARVLAEQSIMNWSQTIPSEFVSALWKAIQDGTAAEPVRQIAAIILKKQVFDKESKESVWEKLTVTLQDDIKNNFIDVLLQFPKGSHVLRALVELFHKIVEAITGADPATLNRKWPNLFTKLIGLYQSGDASKMLTSLRLIHNLCENGFEYLEGKAAELDGLVKVSLVHQDHDIIAEAVKIWCDILTNGEKDVIKKMTVKANAIIPAVFQIVKSDDYLAQTMLECLENAIQGDSKIFKTQYVLLRDSVFEVMESESCSDENKGLAFSSLLSLIESANILKKHKDLQKLLTRVMKQISAICEDPDYNWCKPHEGFDEEEDQDGSNEKNWLSYVDRLFESSTFDPEANHTLIGQLIKDQGGTNCTWQENYALLMVLSQAGEYLDVNSFEIVLELVIKLVKHENPKVRYAALHFIALNSDKHQEEEFFPKHIEKIVPQIIQLLDDPIDRVKAQGLRALAYFIEGCEEGIQVKYVDTLVTKSLALLEGTQISHVKMLAIVLLSAIGEQCKESYEKYLTKVTKLILEILVKQTQEEYKQLRMQAIEHCTLICHTVGADKFGQDALVVLVETMLKIQKSMSEQGWLEKNVSYLLEGWQRLAMALKEKFLGCLTTIWPSLLNILTKLANAEPPETESLQIGVSMLCEIMDGVEGAFGQYVEDTLNLCFKILHSGTLGDCTDILNAVEKSVKCVKDSTSSEISSTFKSTANKVVNEIVELLKIKSGEDDIENCNFVVHTIGKLIEENKTSFLDKDTLEKLTQVADEQIKMVLESLNKTGKTEKEDGDDEDNDDEIEKEDLKTRIDYSITIAETIGQIFLHHSEKILPYVNKLVTSNIIVDNLQPGRLIRYSLFLISDILERLPDDPLKEQWSAIYPKILALVRDPFPSVRHTCAYVIGVLAIKHQNKFEANAQEYVKALVGEIDDMNIGDDDPVNLPQCRENVCAALGKVIRSDPKIVNKPGIKEMNIVHQWLSHLPLKKDKPEALNQHELLCDVLLSDADVVLGEGNEFNKNLEYVITIFGKIHKSTKVCNDTILSKIKKVLEHFRDVEKYLSAISSKVAAAHPEVVQELLGLLSEE